MWITLALSAAFFLSFARFIQRSLLKDGKSDPITYSIYFQILIFCFILPIILFREFSFPPLKQVWWSILLMTILYGVGNIFSYLSIKLIPITEFMIIVATIPLWTALFSILLLNESAGIIKLIGIALTILGIIIAFYSKQKLQIKKGHLFAVFTSISFGLALTNDAFLLNYFDAITYSAIYYILPALFIAILYPKKLIKVTSLFRNGGYKKIIASSVFFGFTGLAVNTSYKLGGEISQISTITQLSTIITIILGITFLNERERIAHKIFGGIIVVLGIVLVQMR